MSIEKIKFNISSDGEVMLNVEGVVGKKCNDLSYPFEQRLGIVSKKELKDSFFVENEMDQESGIGQKSE